jgi:hypothetical protein
MSQYVVLSILIKSSDCILKLLLCMTECWAFKVSVIVIFMHYLFYLQFVLETFDSEVSIRRLVCTRAFAVDQPLEL